MKVRWEMIEKFRISNFELSIANLELRIALGAAGTT